MTKKIRYTFPDGNYHEWIDNSLDAFEPSEKFLKPGTLIEIWIPGTRSHPDDIQILHLTMPGGPK